MKKMIIVGGGIQGCTLAIHLLKMKKLDNHELLIIDKNNKPLSNWKECTNLISMPFLRSPSVHHLDVNPFSLEKFSKKEGFHKVKHFYGYYDRPSLEMFNEHCEAVINDLDIVSCWKQASVTGIEKQQGYWTVETEEGEVIEAENLVLAMGLREHPYWPKWAEKASSENAHIHHVFQKEVPDLNACSIPISIIGGGISAAHLALSLSKKYPGQVSLIYRKDLEVHTFDSDPGWQGPMYMDKFKQIQDYSIRRKTIIEARHKGSVTKELYLGLKSAEKSGKIKLIKNEVQSYCTEEKKLVFQSGETYDAKTVLLATGFHSTPPGIQWLKSVIKHENLRCAKCGYPIVSPETLEWDQGLFVMGPLAELEIGPVSRNIAGARRATERILRAI
ncbi:NAD(P)-binding domain-containing protein [Fictibacillus sp. UD]|uniref:NAD(P)-binding domain-containing protein n=1 Tax=Fictibacillus sp. UD TaxID=3038777 RepID=UPI00374A47B1